MSQAESNKSLKRGGVLPKYPLRAKKGSIALPFPFFALIYIKILQPAISPIHQFISFGKINQA